MTMTTETKYILDGHEPKPCSDPLEWARWMEANKYAPRQLDPEGMDVCRVGSTKVGNAWVSTVFLGVNYNFAEHGRPIVFETMVFGGSLDNEQERYATWDEAETGHAAMVKRVSEKETKA